MPVRRLWKFIAGFTLLFLAYQLPEGIGQRLLGSFPAQAALLLAFFLLAYLIGRTRSEGALAAYALENPGRWWRPLLALFLLAIALKLLTVALGARLGVFQIQSSTAPSAPALAFALLATFLPSLAEDIVTRGYWFPALGELWPPAAFVLASSTLYVLNHIYRLATGPGEWLMLFAFGLAYALALVRFRSLWPAVGLHWGWNFGNALAASICPYNVSSLPGSRNLAIAAHLLMAVLVLAVTPAPEPTAPPSPRPPRP